MLSRTGQEQYSHRIYFGTVIENISNVPALSILRIDTYAFLKWILLYFQVQTTSTEDIANKLKHEGHQQLTLW